MTSNYIVYCTLIMRSHTGEHGYHALLQLINDAYNFYFIKTIRMSTKTVSLYTCPTDNIHSDSSFTSNYLHKRSNRMSPAMHFDKTCSTKSTNYALRRWRSLDILTASGKSKRSRSINVFFFLFIFLIPLSLQYVWRQFSSNKIK